MRYWEKPDQEVQQEGDGFIFRSTMVSHNEDPQTLLKNAGVDLKETGIILRMKQLQYKDTVQNHVLYVLLKSFLVDSVKEKVEQYLKIIWQSQVAAAEDDVEEDRFDDDLSYQYQPSVNGSSSPGTKIMRIGMQLSVRFRCRARGMLLIGTCCT